MKLRLDPKSPIPLYHQIREALRYRIATGRLKAGDALPTVREAAQSWGVNLHTVRRAYRELVEAGLLESRPGLGTQVLGSAARLATGPGPLDAFLARTLAEAQKKHGLSADDLAALLANWTGVRNTSKQAVHVLECNPQQCIDHAQQINGHWGVNARPWCLEQDGEPPPGTLIATYFHYNEIRRRWPKRLHSIRFASIAPDADLAKRLPKVARGAGKLKLLLCEYEDAIARNIAADVSAILRSDKYHIQPKATQDPGELLGPRRRIPALFSPRAWNALSAEQRAHPLAIEIRYSFPLEELQELGRELQWPRAHAKVNT